MHDHTPVTEPPPSVPTPHPMQVTVPGHFLGQLPFYDVLDADRRLIADLHNRPDLANDHGALQGGLVATLIDVVAGRLALNQVDQGHAVSTADMTIHYLAPIRQGPARAEGTIIRSGKNHIVVAVDVTDVGADRHAARATVSFAVLSPR